MKMVTTLGEILVETIATRRGQSLLQPEPLAQPPERRSQSK
jgi:hypothetical protein